MISFLIPTYNYNCLLLVKSLSEQATALKAKLGEIFDFEIIVADDASPRRDMVECYMEMTKWKNCRFMPLSTNMGRAKIRNFLAQQARFPYLVFIDCDAEVCTDDFVRCYWDSRAAGDVICGSLLNPRQCPIGGELRFSYEKAAEGKRTLEFRSVRPYSYFTTFNVMFNHIVFERLQFDERCTEYGYEDALMGLMLQKEGYSVAHIDNPLIHNGIDQSDVYLSKVEESLRVLLRLGEPLQSASALVVLQRKLKKYCLLSPYLVIYRIFKGRWYHNITGRRPSLFLLKLYKLGYYSMLERSSSK